MQNNTRFERNPNFIFRNIVEEMVLVPIHQDLADMDCIYTLNDVGAFIWAQLEQPSSQTDLLKRMQEEYDADPEVLANDLERFLDELLAVDAVRMV